MSKIGDLYVKLSLKQDEFQKGLDKAKGDLEGFGFNLKSVAKVAKVAWAAAAAAVVKVATDSVKLTQKWGDAWNVAMAGMTGAYQAFVRQISSGEGWSGLFANMREAARVARETAAVLDEMFERKNSYSITEANINREIAAQQLIMRDSSKNEEERKAAAEKIIELTTKLGEEKKRIAQDEADAIAKNVMAQTGLNREQLQYLVDEYEQNRDIINQSRAYYAERKRLEKELQSHEQSYNATGNTQYLDRAKETKEALSALEAATSDAVRTVAGLSQKYDKSSDDLIASYVQAQVAVVNAETEALRSQTRATATLGSLNNKTVAGVSSAPLTESPAPATNAVKTELEALKEYSDELAYIRQQDEEFAQGWDDVAGKIEGLNGINLDPAKEELLAMSHATADAVENMMIQEEVMKAIAMDFNRAVVSGFSDGCQELMDQFMGLSEANPGAVVKNLLTPLADMAIREGEILMAQGLGIAAVLKSLTSLNPAAALAAGAALIAIGSAAKAGLTALAQSGSGNTVSSYSGSTSAANGTQTINSELTITVNSRISGKDILLSGQRTAAALAR